MRSGSILAALLLLPVLLPACGGDAEGERAYREGRYEDAHAAFADASPNDDASAVLLHNRALAALRADAWSDADSAAEKAAATGGQEIVARSDFLRGNVAFARSLMAEQQADTPEAEPFAFDVAITYARTALSRWQLAATSRPDWPEARRNVERALLKLADLERKKAEKQQAPRRTPRPQPKILPGPVPEDEGKSTEQEATPEAQKTELSPEQILSLIEKLARKEREKLALRRSHRRVRTVEVEKDW